MKKYSLYLFDFDGTLFDTAGSLREIYRKTFARYDVIPTKEDYYTFLTLSLPRAMVYKGIDKKYQQEFCDYFNRHVLSKDVVEKTKLYPDTMDLFKYVNTHHIKYGIVTGSSTTRVKDVLTYFKLDPHKLAVCVGNDLYKNPKPYPDPILEALKRTNYLNKKDEVLYIGDAKQDEECAKAAGVDYIKIKRLNNKDGDIESLFDLFK